MRRVICWSFVVVLILSREAGAQHNGLRPPSSLLDAFIGADIVAICRLENAVKPTDASPKGHVDLVLENVIRSHMIIEGRKTILHPRYVEPSKEKMLVAVDVDNGTTYAHTALTLDPPREIERYVRGALLLKDKSTLARGRYAVDFLMSKNDEVAKSAHVEVRRLKYSDLRQTAEKFKPDTFVKAIQEAKKLDGRHDLYAELIGFCGGKEHADFLRKQLDGGKSLEGFRKGFLVGYVMLDRENGWKLVGDTIVNKKASFLERYSALMAARSIYEEWKDTAAEKKSLAVIASILDMRDMADFAIEDLRKWKRWEYCDAILKVPEKPGLNQPIIRKSVLRYALQCPTQQAKDYVKAQQARDAEWVNETKELLDLESEADAEKKKGS